MVSKQLKTEVIDDSLDMQPVITNTHLPVDAVPTADDEEPKATYLDYIKTDTRVITYAIGSAFPGIYAETMSVAKMHCNRIHGKILETITVPGRAFFRVFKEKR